MNIQSHVYKSVDEAETLLADAKRKRQIKRTTNFQCIEADYIFLNATDKKSFNNVVSV